MQTTALIMAGGRGERFWPKSRKSTPKQFLSLTNSEKTMIQETVDRMLPLVAIEDIFIATNRDYKNLVKEQLPDLPEENILCEPMAKNTAPCIGWGAVTIRKRYGDAMMIVLPSDHLIQQPALFRGVLKSAIQTAQDTDALVTLGISPTSPDTGYGYIQYDTEEDAVGRAFKVKRFVEKPDLETAKKYLMSGEYLWNSGMFIWKVSTILENIRVFLPDLTEGLARIRESIGTPEYEAVLRASFSAFPSVSVDYGILEKARNIFTLAGTFGWDDVGSWLAVSRLRPTDARGNTLQGNVISVDTENTIVQGGEKLIAVVGVQDMIVVDTKDAILICEKDKAGDIRKVLQALREKGMEAYL